MAIQDLLDQIKALGYRFELLGDNIKFTYIGNGQIPKQVVSIFREIKERKSEIIQYLKGTSTPMPYITDFGSLVIPHNSPQKYHWWNRGQGICDTLRELGRCDLIQKYKSIYSN